MSKGRKRHCNNRKLPKNLYRNRKAYRYRHPETGQFIPLGDDEAAAVRAAHQANFFYASKHIAENPILNPEASTVTKSKTVEEVISEYEIYCKKKTKSKITFKAKKYQLTKFSESFGSKTINSIDVRFLSNWLDDNIKGYDSWIKNQGTLAAIFAYSLGKGYLPSNHGNPARHLIKPIKEPKRRMRLTLEEYKVIYKFAPDWLQTAMDISLQTTLRIGDILSLRFENIVDDYLFVVPQKTKDLTSPINLKIKMGDRLKNIIKRARLSGIASPYIVHRRPEKIKSEQRDSKEHWTQVLPNYTSQVFAEAREQTQLFKDLESGQAPTFHEIRALSSFMYKTAGRDLKSMQTLMGHSSTVMTQHYQSGHAIEYSETWADLSVE